MTQRTTTAEKPAPKQHRGRMGCLVIIGVIMLVVVGTVFAPDFPRQAVAPSPSPSPVAAIPASVTLNVAATPEVLPSTSPITGLSSTQLIENTPAVTKTPPDATQTQAVASPIATSERESGTPIATPSTVYTATPSPSLTRTSPPTPTPTILLILATNTHPPLVIITNTPFISGE